MPFTLIKGTFHVVGYSPDGDSVRFRADERENWTLLGGPPVELTARDHVQLRFEAIDTPEIYYEGRHQPLGPAMAALEFLLAEVGIKDLQLDDGSTRIVSAKDGTRGCILSRQT